jgi:hypothetical protein
MRYQSSSAFATGDPALVVVHEQTDVREVIQQPNPGIRLESATELTCVTLRSAASRLGLADGLAVTSDEERHDRKQQCDTQYADAPPDPGNVVVPSDRAIE